MMTSQEPVEVFQILLGENLDANFELFMRTYQDRLYSFALRLSGNAQDAEEIVQDAFVKAYRALQGYPAERIREMALRPWLYQITLNTFRNRVRGKRLRTVSIDDGVSDNEDWDLVDHERRGPAAAAEHEETQARLAALLMALPDRYRAAVVLRYVEGLSYAELAEVLGQPIGTAKANVHRGLQKLRAQVSADGRSDRELEVNYG